MNEIRYAVIHHSASPPGVTTAEIRKWHIQRGWVDIGYHYVIEEDASVHVGRPVHIMGAHCKGHNRNSIGVCVVGDNTRAAYEWNKDQISTLYDIIKAIRLLWPAIKVVGHRELVNSTVCPGVDISDLLKENA